MSCVVQPIRVLLVSDDEPFLEALCRAVRAQPGLALAGAGSHVAEHALGALAAPPAVVVLDLQAARGGRAQAIGDLLAQSPRAVVIVLAREHEHGEVFSAIKRGARGLILKPSSPAAVLQTIRAVAEGESVIDPPLTAHVFREFHRLWNQADPLRSTTLSAQEESILGLVAAGHSDLAIATLLRLPEAAIRDHLALIAGKLHLGDRAQVRKHEPAQRLAPRTVAGGGAAAHAAAEPVGEPLSPGPPPAAARCAGP